MTRIGNARRLAFALTCALAACHQDRGGAPDLSAGGPAGSDGNGDDAGDLGGADGAAAGGRDGGAGGGRDAGVGGNGGDGGGGNIGGNGGGGSGQAGDSDGGDNSGDGGILWTHVVGGAQWDELDGLALDSNGNVIIAGQIENTVDIGCGALAGQYRDILVASLAPSDGKCRWSQHYGSTADESAQALALGPHDEVYIGGHFRSDKLDLGGGVLPKFATNWDAPFVAEFTQTATGLQHQWSTAFIGQGAVSWLDLHASALRVTGSYYEDLQILSGQSVARCCVSFDGMYVGSLAAANGQPAWAHGARVTADNNSDMEAAWSTATQGNLTLVTGFVEGAAEFGATKVASVGERDGYLAAYAADTGALQWVRTWGIAGNTFSEGWRLQAEPDGSFLFTGTAEEGVDLGDGPLVGYGDHAFVERLDAQGNVTQRLVLYIEYGEITGMARRPDGRIAVVGSYRGTVDFGGTVLTSEPSGDPFVAVLAADLSQVDSAETLHTSGEDFLFNQIVVDKNGRTYLGINFVDWIELRGRHITGAGGWDFLVAALP